MRYRGKAERQGYKAVKLMTTERKVYKHKKKLNMENIIHEGRGWNITSC